MDSFLTDAIDTIDPTGTIGKRVLNKVVDKSISTVSRLFSSKSESIPLEVRGKYKDKGKDEEAKSIIANFDLEIKSTSVFDQIVHNLQKTETWSKEIGFRAALRSKELIKIFVDMELFVSPLIHRLDDHEKIQRIKSQKILSNFENHKVIFGNAGAGKTTLLKKLCADFIKAPDDFPFTCPLVIRFREVDYSGRDSNFGLFKILLDALGIRVSFPPEYFEFFNKEYCELLNQSVISFLDTSNVLLIADGFDEIPVPSIKDRIQKDFRELALGLNQARFIVTSRNTDFTLELPKTEQYQICPLNEKQIQKVVKKWLRKKSDSEDLFNQIKSSTYYDTTMRPLTLSHLCAIYERRRTIPPKPRFIYGYVVNLLIEEWDHQRSVRRPSRYANFYLEKKMEFLSHLAYWFSNINVFTSQHLRKCYREIHSSHNLPPSQAKKIVTELESHTGLLERISYDLYQFSHKSLQEFLTAKHISRLPRPPAADVMASIPNEMAIVVAISSNPNQYFGEILSFTKELDSAFVIPFLNRLFDERPDFTPDPVVLVFFLWALEKTSFDLKTELEHSMIQYIEQTNLRIGLPNFHSLYAVNAIYEEGTQFIHRKTNTSLAERNNFPGRIFAPKSVVDFFRPR